MSSDPPPTGFDRPEAPAAAVAVPAAEAPRRPTPDPTRTLAPEARTYWTLVALAQTLPLLVLLAIFGPAAAGRLPAPLVVAVAVLVPVAVAMHVIVVPRLRWRRWRYEVREEEIDLQRGTFTVVRTLVPMSRVQHVDTRRTVVSEMFGLAAVVFHTAAGANAIPALADAEANAIRDRIADLAATADDPV